MVLCTKYVQFPRDKSPTHTPKIGKVKYKKVELKKIQKSNFIDIVHNNTQRHTWQSINVN